MEFGWLLVHHGLLRFEQATSTLNREHEHREKAMAGPHFGANSFKVRFFVPYRTPAALASLEPVPGSAFLRHPCMWPRGCAPWAPDRTPQGWAGAHSDLI